MININNREVIKFEVYYNKESISPSDSAVTHCYTVYEVSNPCNIADLIMAFYKAIGREAGKDVANIVIRKIECSSHKVSYTFNWVRKTVHEGWILDMIEFVG